MKITFEEAKQILLEAGFTQIENTLNQYRIITMGTFAMNYCSCCKRFDCIIEIYKNKGEKELEYSVDTPNGGGVDYLRHLKSELRRMGCKKPKEKKLELIN